MSMSESSKMVHEVQGGARTSSVSVSGVFLGTYRVHIRKEALKFSAAHMTILPDGSKERLHGHNYATEVIVDFSHFSLKSMVPFSEIKAAMKRICERWDEKILLPLFCPHFSVRRKDHVQVEFELCGKYYSFPVDEVECLPVENITSETLAFQFAQELLAQLADRLVSAGATRVEVRVDETSGQGASFVWLASSSQDEKREQRA